jgi:NADPH:quinone reductase-like Zn-dependent oxidoreductase
MKSSACAVTSTPAKDHRHFVIVGATGMVGSYALGYALDARAPKNVVVVAMANKLARIAWAVLSSGQDYRPTANAVAA